MILLLCLSPLLVQVCVCVFGRPYDESTPLGVPAALPLRQIGHDAPPPTASCISPANRVCRSIGGLSSAPLSFSSPPLLQISRLPGQKNDADDRLNWDHVSFTAVIFSPDSPPLPLSSIFKLQLSSRRLTTVQLVFDPFLSTVFSFFVYD